LDVVHASRGSRDATLKSRISPSRVAAQAFGRQAPCAPRRRFFSLQFQTARLSCSLRDRGLDRFTDLPNLGEMFCDLGNHVGAPMLDLAALLECPLRHAEPL